MSVYQFFVVQDNLVKNESMHLKIISVYLASTWDFLQFICNSKSNKIWEVFFAIFWKKKIKKRWIHLGISAEIQGASLKNYDHRILSWFFNQKRSKPDFDEKSALK